MQRYLIATGSITYAIRGRDLLRDLGYKARMERRTSGQDNLGCGYVIVFEGDIEKAKAALENAGVRILQIKTL